MNAWNNPLKQSHLFRSRLGQHLCLDVAKRGRLTGIGDEHQQLVKDGGIHHLHQLATLSHRLQLKYNNFEHIQIILNGLEWDTRSKDHIAQITDECNITRAVVFRLFQKTVILPPNPVGFRLTYSLPNCETYVSSDMYQFAWIKHQSVSSVVQGFCSTNKTISIHYLWKCDWTIMIFINLMLVMISLTHVFTVFNNISASSWAKT